MTLTPSIGLVLGEKIPNQQAGKPPKTWEIGELRIVTETNRWPVKTARSIFGGNDYDLTPEYQRRRRWDTPRRSRLIESIILNIPIPPIFLYERELGRYEVMDGLQRLTTILEFYDDKFQLTGLEILRNLNGEKYSTLPVEVQRQFDRSQLSGIVLLEESIKEKDQQNRMKQLVFQRINSGGVQLSNQEARNALLPGAMNDLCIELSQHESFRFCWGFPPLEQCISEPEEEDEEDDDADGSTKISPPADRKVIDQIRRMDDVEYALRFFAMRQRADFERLPLRDYLDLYIARANHFEAGTIADLRKIFDETFNLLREILGENAFRRWQGARWARRRSPLAYDAITQSFSMLLPHKERITQQKDTIVRALQATYIKNKDRFSASYTSYRYHAQRVSWIMSALQPILSS